MPPDNRANPGYALRQLHLALESADTHPDEDTRQRARSRSQSWLETLQGMLSGRLKIGSRTPVGETPAWATLEVLRGGFASGKLLAAGELSEDEKLLAARLGISDTIRDRAPLNLHYLSDEGQQFLASGCYRIDLPEHAALPIVQWLLAGGHEEAARTILREIAPYFGRLRFYPVETSTPPEPHGLYFQPLRNTRLDLSRIQVPLDRRRHRESLQVWLPFYDRMVEFFSQAEEKWLRAAPALWREYQVLRRQHTLTRNNSRPRDNFSRLLATLEVCAIRPGNLSPRDRGYVRRILRDIEASRSAEERRELRARQAKEAAKPHPGDFTAAVLARLAPLPAEEPLTQSVAELLKEIPETVCGVFEPLLRRSIPGSLAQLMEDRVLTSAEMLASVVPQLSSELEAQAYSDPHLQRLVGDLYRAFRRRRSLLLLNLESQVKLKELPWHRAVDSFRRTDSLASAVRAQMTELVRVSLQHWPWVPLPNPLVEELRSLARLGGIDLPLVEELAADIFVGEFTEHFLTAAKRAARFLQGTVYARYYDIPCDHIAEMKSPTEFRNVCYRRAGQERGKAYSIPANGAVIEQSLILTAHNLAVLFSELDLHTMHPDHALAQRCYEWICWQRSHNPKGRGALRSRKNCAYAWRQLLFFLSVGSKPANSFAPENEIDLLNGLRDAIAGRVPAEAFLGWVARKTIAR